jgi:hypothetical protein
LIFILAVYGTIGLSLLIVAFKEDIFNLKGLENKVFEIITIVLFVAK